MNERKAAKVLCQLEEQLHEVYYRMLALPEVYSFDNADMKALSHLEDKVERFRKYFGRGRDRYVRVRPGCNSWMESHKIAIHNRW